MDGVMLQEVLGTWRQRQKQGVERTLVKYTRGDYYWHHLWGDGVMLQEVLGTYRRTQEQGLERKTTGGALLSGTLEDTTASVTWRRNGVMLQEVLGTWRHRQKQGVERKMNIAGKVHLGRLLLVPPGGGIGLCYRRY